MNYVIGAEEIIMNLNRAKIVWLGKIADAVESSLVDGVNHAKSNHEVIINDSTRSSLRYQNRTSNLTKSIFPKMTEISINRVTGVIAAGEDYAFHQEFGTSKMRARPFLFPALVHIQPIFKARLMIAIGRL